MPPALAEPIARHLEREGLEPRSVPVWSRVEEAALIVAFTTQPHALTGEIRAATTAPLVVVAQASARERAAALTLGADVCLDAAEPAFLVAAQVSALFRRMWRGTEAGFLEAGRLRVDVQARRAWCADEEMGLAPREFDLLVALIERSGRAMRRHELLDAAWGSGFMGTPGTVDVHVSWLRQKLGARSGVRITTLRGIGYRLDVLTAGPDSV